MSWADPGFRFVSVLSLSKLAVVAASAFGQVLNFKQKFHLTQEIRRIAGFSILKRQIDKTADLRRSTRIASELPAYRGSLTRLARDAAFFTTSPQYRLCRRATPDLLGRTIRLLSSLRISVRLRLSRDRDSVLFLQLQRPAQDRFCRSASLEINDRLSGGGKLRSAS